MTDQITLKFKDGSTGVLPLKQAEALENILQYNWDEELMSYNLHFSEDKWLKEPVVGLGDKDDEDGIRHIIHDLAALRVE